MRFTFLLVLSLPLFASAQRADTSKRETRLKDYALEVNGGYGTGKLYSAGLDVYVALRKINFRISGEQFVGRRSGNDFHLITYRGSGMYYDNFGRTPATMFPESFRFPSLNRLTKQASGEVSWQLTKKLKIDLSGSYTWTDDTVGFSVERQVFTGNNFRTIHSTHSGGLVTENRRATLEFRYPKNSDNSVIRFKSTIEDETKNLSLLNTYATTGNGFPWGFTANSSNHDVSNRFIWSTNVSTDKLWLPWVDFVKYKGPAFARKSVRLKLSHIYRMQRGISNLFTRTDIVPEAGPVIAGNDRIFYIRDARPFNEFSALVSVFDLMRLKKPELAINFMFSAMYSEQPWTQRATRIDSAGVNAEEALHISSLLTTKQFISTLMGGYKRVSFGAHGQSSEINVHDESGGVISKRRFMVLPWLKFVFLNVSVKYEMSMLSPATFNMLPNPDWRNPAYVKSGNPDMEFGRKNELTIEKFFYRTRTSEKDSSLKGGWTISCYGFISQSRNPVMWLSEPDSAGVLYVRPVNLPYMWSSVEEIELEQKFFRPFRLTASLAHAWSRYDYPINDTMRTANNQTVRGSMELRYHPGKKLMMYIHGGYTFVHADYTNEKRFTRGYQSFDATFWIDVKVFDHLRFDVTSNFVHFTGPQEMGRKSIVFFSSFVEWSKPRGRFTARLTINDWFNRNIYFGPTDAHAMVQRVSGIAAGRYALLTATWRFSKPYSNEAKK